MKIILAIFLLIGISCNCIQDTEWAFESSEHRWARSIEARVDGGIQPRRHEYRFLVLFEGTYASGDLCHGVLVAPHIVLGSAQSSCSKNPTPGLVAKAGMHDLSQRENTVQTRDVCHVDVHSSARANGSFSYAIYYLSDPFDLNDHVGTIQLPLETKLTSGSECRAVSCTSRCFISTWSKDRTVPNHISLKLRTCSNDGSYFCADQGPCDELGAPLVCTAGNLQFTPGTHANSGCETDKAVFASFFNDNFRSWYNSRVNAVPKTCRPVHG